MSPKALTVGITPQPDMELRLHVNKISGTSMKGDSIPPWGQHPGPAPREGDAAGKPKEQDTDQARRAEAQRCRRRGKTQKEVVNFDFSDFLATLQHPGQGQPCAWGLTPTLTQEVFQARLRHRRNCLCFQDHLGFLPTASPTSTWCQTIEKKILERMKREELSCTTTERRHRSMKHQPRHTIHFYLQSRS